MVADNTKALGILGQIHAMIDPVQAMGGYGGTALMGMGAPEYNLMRLLAMKQAIPEGVRPSAFVGKFDPKELAKMLQGAKVAENPYAKQEAGNWMQNMLDDAYYGGMGTLGLAKLYGQRQGSGNGQG